MTSLLLNFTRSLSPLPVQIPVPVQMIKLITCIIYCKMSVQLQVFLLIIIIGLQACFQLGQVIISGQSIMIKISDLKGIYTDFHVVKGKEKVKKTPLTWIKTCYLLNLGESNYFRDTSTLSTSFCKALLKQTDFVIQIHR